MIIARISGFCDGVKRAMRLALAAAKDGGVWADGPLVHNHQALSLMSLQGIAASESPRTEDGTVLIRAHGATPERRRELEESGLKVVDATCVHVARNQRLASRAAAGGMTVVLAGDPEHAEVHAVCASAGSACRVVARPEDIAALDVKEPVLFLAQTTFNLNLFAEMTTAMRGRFPDCRVIDTICRATHDRQREAARIARLADVLVVVGGRHSANTRRLADTGAAEGKPVFLVETADELRGEDFAGFATVAVTSGASTPGWVTQEVVNRLLFMGRSSFLVQLLRIMHLLAMSRVLTALSAAGMALAAQMGLLGTLQPALAVAGAGYVFFAHTLSRRVPTDPEARRLSLVDSFYQSRRSPMLIAAWLAAAAALYLAAGYGIAVFSLYGLAVLAAAIFAHIVRHPMCIPDWLKRFRKWLPGSFSAFRSDAVKHENAQNRPAVVEKAPRTFNRVASLRHGAMAIGWSLILAGPPSWESGHPGTGFGALFFVFLICLGGTLIRDLHDIASDRLMGIDTLPARWGPSRAGRRAMSILGLAAALPVAAAAWALTAQEAPTAACFAFLLFLPVVPGWGVYLLDRVAARCMPDAVFLQACVDGMGCLAGGLALGMWVLS